MSRLLRGAKAQTRGAGRGLDRGQRHADAGRAEDDAAFAGQARCPADWLAAVSARRGWFSFILFVSGRACTAPSPIRIRRPSGIPRFLLTNFLPLALSSSKLKY